MLHRERQIDAPDAVMCVLSVGTRSFGRDVLYCGYQRGSAVRCGRLKGGRRLGPLGIRGDRETAMIAIRRAIDRGSGKIQGWV
jgi:hypothetical protein